MDVLTIEQIKNNYPNQWVVIALDGDDIQHKPEKGVVLLHGKDYLELCYQARDIAKNIVTTTFFTGTSSVNRKWLKSIRLQEQPKTI